MVRRMLVVFLAALTAAAIAAGCAGENKAGEQGSQEPGGQEAKKTEEAKKGGEEDGGSSGSGGEQFVPIDVSSPVHGTSYVAPLVEIFGDVSIGEESFVASNTILRASPERRLQIGSETNAQDNIIVRALERSSSIGSRTSLAHHAIIRDSDIGDFAFVGFNAEVVDSIVGNGAFILHGARVEGVEIPENALVDVGQQVTTQQQADALPTAPEATEEFREEVLEVNRELASGYISLYDDGEGYRSVIEVGPNPETSYLASTEPRIGEGADIREFVRIVGDVRIGSNARIDQRSALRADDGSPITLGNDAVINNRVTFHALKGTGIEVGDDLTAGDDVVFHGPLRMGNGITVGNDSVVFRVVVGNNAEIGDRATIAGPAPEEEGEDPPLRIPPGTNIPAGAVITNQEQLDDVLEQQ